MVLVADSSLDARRNIYAVLLNCKIQLPESCIVVDDDSDVADADQAREAYAERAGARFRAASPAADDSQLSAAAKQWVAAVCAVLADAPTRAFALVARAARRSSHRAFVVAFAGELRRGPWFGRLFPVDDCDSSSKDGLARDFHWILAVYEFSMLLHDSKIMRDDRLDAATASGVIRMLHDARRENLDCALAAIAAVTQIAHRSLKVKRILYNVVGKPEVVTDEAPHGMYLLLAAVLPSQNEVERARYSKFILETPPPSPMHSWDADDSHDRYDEASDWSPTSTDLLVARFSAIASLFFWDKRSGVEPPSFFSSGGILDLACEVVIDTMASDASSNDRTLAAVLLACKRLGGAQQARVYLHVCVAERACLLLKESRRKPVSLLIRTCSAVATVCSISDVLTSQERDLVDLLLALVESGHNNDDCSCALVQHALQAAVELAKRDSQYVQRTIAAGAHAGYLALSKGTRSSRAKEILSCVRRLANDSQSDVPFVRVLSELDADVHTQVADSDNACLTAVLTLLEVLVVVAAADVDPGEALAEAALTRPTLRAALDHFFEHAALLHRDRKWACNSVRRMIVALWDGMREAFAIAAVPSDGDYLSGDSIAAGVCVPFEELKPVVFWPQSLFIVFDALCAVGFQSRHAKEMAYQCCFQPDGASAHEDNTEICDEARERAAEYLTLVVNGVELAENAHMMVSMVVAALCRVLRPSVVDLVEGNVLMMQETMLPLDSGDVRQVFVEELSDLAWNMTRAASNMEDKVCRLPAGEWSLLSSLPAFRIASGYSDHEAIDVAPLDAKTVLDQCLEALRQRPVHEGRTRFFHATNLEFFSSVCDQGLHRSVLSRRTDFSVNGPLFYLSPHAELDVAVYHALTKVLQKPRPRTSPTHVRPCILVFDIVEPEKLDKFACLTLFEQYSTLERVRFESLCGDAAVDSAAADSDAADDTADSDAADHAADSQGSHAANSDATDAETSDPDAAVSTSKQEVEVPRDLASTFRKHGNWNLPWRIFVMYHSLKVQKLQVELTEEEFAVVQALKVMKQSDFLYGAEASDRQRGTVRRYGDREVHQLAAQTPRAFDHVEQSLTAVILLPLFRYQQPIPARKR